MYHACTMDAQAKLPSHVNPLGFRKKMVTLLDLCVSSLRRGHANLLCIVPILTGVIQQPVNGRSRTMTLQSDKRRPPSPTGGGASPPATRGQLRWEVVTPNSSLRSLFAATRQLFVIPPTTIKPLPSLAPSLSSHS